VLPKEAYTPWSSRLGAFLVDLVPAAVVFGIGSVIGNITADCAVVRPGAPGVGYCGWAVSESGGTLLMLGFVLALALYFLTLAYLVWNFGYRQGKTGSSIGKSALKFKVVNERTWQPIGFWQSIARQIAHWVDQLACYVGFLWPLWDDKRQTFADKIMTTVCVPLNSPPPPRAEAYSWPG
jgi:uncharacterized RDD family membrane protein YckC